MEIIQRESANTNSKNSRETHEGLLNGNMIIVLRADALVERCEDDVSWGCNALTGPDSGGLVRSV